MTRAVLTPDQFQQGLGLVLQLAGRAQQLDPALLADLLAFLDETIAVNKEQDPIAQLTAKNNLDDARDTLTAVIHLRNTIAQMRAKRLVKRAKSAKK